MRISVPMAAVVAMVLSGCATEPPPNYSARAMGLKIGESKDQVIALMGPPRKNAAMKTDEGVSERYFWWSPTRIGFTPIDNEMLSPDRVFVRFLDGKVVEWGDKYDPTAMMDRSMESANKISKSLQPGRPAASGPTP